jgi:hypothetical protein
MNLDEAKQHGTGIAGAMPEEIDTKTLTMEDTEHTFGYKLVRVDSILGPLWVTDRSARQITVIDQWARVGRAMEDDGK